MISYEQFEEWKKREPSAHEVIVVSVDEWQRILASLGEAFQTEAEALEMATDLQVVRQYGQGFAAAIGDLAHAAGRHQADCSTCRQAMKRNADVIARVLKAAPTGTGSAGDLVAAVSPASGGVGKTDAQTPCDHRDLIPCDCSVRKRAATPAASPREATEAIVAALRRELRQAKLSGAPYICLDVREARALVESSPDRPNDQHGKPNTDRMAGAGDQSSVESHWRRNRARGAPETARPIHPEMPRGIAPPTVGSGQPEGADRSPQDASGPTAVAPAPEPRPQEGPTPA